VSGRIPDYFIANFKDPTALFTLTCIGRDECILSHLTLRKFYGILRLHVRLVTRYRKYKCFL